LQRKASKYDERVKHAVLTAAVNTLELQLAGVMSALRCQISLNSERVVQLRTPARQVLADIQQLE
jgi:MarR family transcriptional regulator, organic hydroperoxide resistance regulator